MAINRSIRYPGRFDAPTIGQPEGAFKNKTAPGAEDGSYLEEDWMNDFAAFFSSLLDGDAATGIVDEVGASQYFNKLQSVLDTYVEIAGDTMTGPLAVPAGGVGSQVRRASETDTLLDLKAPLASPGLTGVPTAPTASPGTGTTQLATTAYVENRDVSHVVNTGSNANGSYRVWSDGYLEQWKTNGEGDTSPDTWTFPAEFDPTEVAANNINLNISAGHSTSVQGAAFDRNSLTSTSVTFFRDASTFIYLYATGQIAP